MIHVKKVNISMQFQAESKDSHIFYLEETLLQIEFSIRILKCVSMETSVRYKTNENFEIRCYKTSYLFL